jgi:hypothetical protein
LQHKNATIAPICTYSTYIETISILPPVSAHQVSKQGPSHAGSPRGFTGRFAEVESRLELKSGVREGRGREGEVRKGMGREGWTEKRGERRGEGGCVRRGRGGFEVQKVKRRE